MKITRESPHHIVIRKWLLFREKLMSSYRRDSKHSKHAPDETPEKCHLLPGTERHPLQCPRCPAKARSTRDHDENGACGTRTPRKANPWFTGHPQAGSWESLHVQEPESKNTPLQATAPLGDQAPGQARERFGHCPVLVSASCANVPVETLLDEKVVRGHLRSGGNF